MSFSIEGWIEVCRSQNCDEDLAWFGVIDIGSLIDVGDEVSEQLFGLSRECCTGKHKVAALAAKRGAPANPSASVKHQLDLIKDHEAKFGAGEFGGYTHATWGEVRSHPIKSEDLQGSGWELVFDLASQLKHRFSPEQIRFIVWFCW